MVATIIVGVPFIIWDMIFTKHLVWGFTEDYLLGVQIGNLPVEEVSFFIVVPFACTFIYECVKYYFQKVDFSKFNFIFLPILLGYAIVLISINPMGWYSLSSVTLSILVIGFLFIKRKVFSKVPIAFFISLVPFLMVNGVLTGFGIENEIVWYNEGHFSSLRIITIPFEDVLYSFSLIVLNILVFESLKSKFQTS